MRPLLFSTTLAALALWLVCGSAAASGQSTKPRQLYTVTLGETRIVLELGHDVADRKEGRHFYTRYRQSIALYEETGDCPAATLCLSEPEGRQAPL